MSNELTVYSEEFNETENNYLAVFIEKGCPGLQRVDETKLKSWFELYMAGKTYLEISQITKDKIELILYISYKSKWQETKMEYFQDISKNLSKKVASAKLESANTVMSVMAALGKYQKKKADKYIETNNDELIENTDVKLLAAYLKTVDVLDKMMMIGGDKQTSPVVNFNVGGNASISQKSDGSIEVNSDAGVSDLLKSLADFKKSQEKKQ